MKMFRLSYILPVIAGLGLSLGGFGLGFNTSRTR